MKADDEKKLAERKRHAKVARDALGENLRAIRKKKKGTGETGGDHRAERQ